MTEFARELEVAGHAAREAGAVILEHYAKGGIAVETKPDQSPVTAADRDANAIIVARLRAAFPDDGLLSEETPDDPQRLAKRRVWIVDPLDGTRDFVARTGDFCVHIGLAIDGLPVMGAVFHPLSGALFVGAAGGGAFVESGDGQRTPLRVSSIASATEIRVGVSRANATTYLRQCLTDTGLLARAVTMGASVKLMALARGEIDAVVNFSAGEQDWDTCAPEIIVREAGGTFTDADGDRFRYNLADVSHHRGSIASNGACAATVMALVRPYARFEDTPQP